MVRLHKIHKKICEAHLHYLIIFIDTVNKIFELKENEVS